MFEHGRGVASPSAAVFALSSSRLLDRYALWGERERTG
jgi:hypothetical protein